jgi:hypothetical protein
MKQMEINYIVLAHKQPRQLKRLVEKLNGIDCNFYIHIDKSADILPFINEMADIKNVYFLTKDKREYTIWGDIGLVKATINAFAQIIADNRKGFCILLSGQDYPIKDNDHIKSFLENNPDTNFISTFPLPHGGWANGGTHRLTHYKVNMSFKSKDVVLIPSLFEKVFYTKRTIKNIVSLLLSGKVKFIYKILKKRNAPGYIQPYGGEHWWALPIDTIYYIVEFLEKHKDYYAFHKDSLLPEEMFFHSIVMHLFDYKKCIIKPTLTYVNWERKNVILPVTFDVHDFDELKTQPTDKLFARKFDIETDEDILDLIDKKILKDYSWRKNIAGARLIKPY